MTALSVRAYRDSTGSSLAGGLRHEFAAKGVHSLRALLRTEGGSTVNWYGAQVADVVGGGTVGTKLVIAVLADGYAANDQGTYNAVVDTLLVTGLFGLDFYAANASRFLVRRVGLVSGASGVGKIKFATNADGSLQTDGAGQLIVDSTTTPDTALGMLYSGVQRDCWVRYGSDTERWITKALDVYVEDFDIAIMLLNEPGFGGCGGGGRLVVPAGVGADTIAHELGHALGGLADEYSAKADTYSGAEPGEPNVTAASALPGLKWAGYVASGTPIPSGSGANVDWTAGPKPAAWDDNTSVGLFEGAYDKFDRGIYRPVISCRMRNNAPPYCPVCRDVMNAKLNAFLSPAAPPGAAPGAPAYVRLTVRSDGGVLRITDAKTVAGELAPGELAPGLAQRTTVGDRTIALGNIVGEPQINRSFQNLEEGAPVPHRTHALETFEFFVRVPADALQGVSPEELAIELLDVPPAETPRGPGGALEIAPDARTLSRLTPLNPEILSGRARRALFGT